MLNLPTLYAILDATILPVDSGSRATLLSSLIAELLDAGVSLLQYRNKQGSDDQVLADCALLRAATQASNNRDACTLILNDLADLVAATSFDGLHIGQGDISPAEARAILGPNKILGISTHNEDQLKQANTTTADYLAIGPIFATTSKQDPDPVVGLETLRRARALTSKPLVAIGGITIANCHSVRAVGADSVAIISALLKNPSGDSVGKTARDFFAELR